MYFLTKLILEKCGRRHKEAIRESKGYFQAIALKLLPTAKNKIVSPMHEKIEE